MPSTPFVLSSTAGDALLNNLTWLAGFRFVNVSGEPVVVTHLGRRMISGNSQTHALSIYSNATPPIQLGTVTIDCAGGTPGEFIYGELSSPVTINPSEVAFFVSQETSGGDRWQSNGGTVLTTTNIGTISSGWVVVGDAAYNGWDAGRSNVPVSFQYSSPIASWSKAGNVYTTDGKRYSVQAAINDASDGDIIEIPAGSFTWGAGQAYLSIPKAITLRGAGTGLTTINIADTGGTYTNATIRVSAAATIKDFTIQQSSSASATSAINCGTANGWRITNIVYNSDTVAQNGYFVYFTTFGLIDNCTVTGGVGSDEWIFGRGPFDAWQSASNKGSVNAVYVEDCTLTGQGYLDANANASVVVRNCTITPTTGAIKLDGHGQYSNTPARSFRLMECYRNTWTTSNGSNPCFEIRGGTGFIWDNVSASGPIYVGDYRVVNGANTVSDYPLYDQVGTGQDPFPASAAGEPLYLWNNTRSSGGSNWAATQAIYGTSMVGLVNPDRDYFETDTSFDGTSGVGRGTRAQMDAITPTLTGVGFWVTDEGSWDTTLSANTSGRLYRWNGSAWVLYYTPYTYPHPLRGTVSAPVFTTQPQDETVNSGDDVTLTVAVSGYPTPELQWRWGGDDMPGETSTSLVLTNLTTGGVYDCVATNSEGTATSDPAVITVLSPFGSGTGNPLGNRGSIMLALGAF